MIRSALSCSLVESAREWRARMNRFDPGAGQSRGMPLCSHHCLIMVPAVSPIMRGTIAVAHF